jgi:hypothetical protein
MGIDVCHDEGAPCVGKPLRKFEEIIECLTTGRERE